MIVARQLPENSNHEPKKAKVAIQPALSFSERDKLGTIQPHDDALVVTLRIGEYDMRRVMVDQGSVAEIMYPDLYKGLGLKPEDLTSYDSSLVGFDGKMVIPMGQVKLPVQTGSEVVEVNFIVVDVYSPYTAIVARSWLHAMGTIPSTLHLKVKYPSGDQVEELIGSQSTARQCMVAAIRHQAGGGSSASDEHGAQLPQEKEELMKFLKGNLNVFAWNAYEAPEVNPSFICHHLNVNPTVVPKKQPPRRSSKEHSKAVKEEVIRLKQAGTIKELFYLDWLDNTVVVKKKNGKWRACVDFTNLNKTCPKDPFPMPRIDQLVDATVGHPRMSF
ncbi:uncharacterized protein LOC112034295 [Quercus suber]|uniref:uncharacterized protein LOC112034295 n=1 Tax=Quercus suber TaxID=58331 RepID=UPI000CE28AB4|nr:uncharacterized protein LOC112034295 [Quercus suber]